MTAIQKVLMATALCFVLSVPAHSHTQLSSSVPANDALLEEAPTEIVLTFSEVVRLTAVTLEHDEESQPLEVSVADATKEFTVGLPELEPGDYVVQWRALSEDTHVVSGEIRFSISS